MSSEDMHAGSKPTAGNETRATLPDLLCALERGVESEASDAATEITRRFQPLIYKFWRQQGCGDYQDFLQDVMVRLFTALPNLRDYRAFPGFFRRIVVTTAADYWRNQGPHLAQLEDVDMDTLVRAFNEDLTTPLVVRTYLDWLPPREREILEFAFLEDLDAREIALRTGLTTGAVRMTKSRAIQRLRSLIEDKSKSKEN
jgi:RNA polymerase sigma factor (sigma-70 family)